MHFSDIHENSGAKLTKLAIVAALHVAVATAVIHSIDTVHLKGTTIKDLVTVFIPTETPPVEPPPPEPAKPRATVTDMKIPVPVIEPIEMPRDVIRADVIKPGEPTLPGEPGGTPGPSTEQVITPAVNSGVMHTAVLADANACRKPDYPARAARMGEQGTVSLALLVGVDGKVASARVQGSSGSRELDRAAVNALSLCQFKAATRGGVPEQAWAQIAYVWTLE